MTLIAIIYSLSFVFCNMMGEQYGKKAKVIAVAGSDTIDFKTQVQPIFQKNCTPCHFPGGKMYERMPFDKGQTIVAFKGKIAKRIKDGKDLALIKQFISQNK
jgi:hypothetical protein